MQSRPVLRAIILLLCAAAIGATLYVAKRVSADLEAAGRNQDTAQPPQPVPSPPAPKQAPAVANTAPQAGKPAPKASPDPGRDTRQAAAKPEWRQKLDDGLAAYRDKRPDEAISHYANAIGIAQRSGRPAVIGVVLGNTGSLYWSMRKLDLAEVHLLRAIEITDRLGEPEIVAELGAQESMLAGRTQRALALVYRDQGRNAEAITHFEKALAATRELKATRPDTIGFSNASNLFDIAVLQCRSGNKEAAAKALAEARRWNPQHPSAEHRQKAYARLEEKMAGGRGC